MSKTNIVIADDRALVRDGISRALGAIDSVSVAASVADGYSAIKACQQLQCEVLLMDLSIEHPSGIEVLRRVQKAAPKTKVVIMASKASARELFLALSMGAIGVVPHQAGTEDVVNAINAARAGYSFLPCDFADWLVGARRNVARKGNAFGLSSREIEILAASVNGHSAKEVAQQLSISVRTVETHRTNIYRKTDSRSVNELAMIAGALDLEPAN